MLQNYINHIVFVVDQSGSMQGISSETVKVFDNEIKNLSRRSQEVNQETRVSVYLFNNDVQCLVYDMDVMRLPSLSKYYKASGGTALIDGTLMAISDLKKTPELYGDHAFLVYVLTDGEENRSRGTSAELSRTIGNLSENWTIAVLVPDSRGVYEAKKFGFPQDNIAVWDSSSEAGMKEVGSVLSKTTDNYFVSRSRGIRGTKSLFKLDVDLSSKVVTKVLDELNVADYYLLNVNKDVVIKDFVESWKIPFRQGANYYQLMKSETIQNYKMICVQDKLNGKVFTGANARKLLGLPDYEVKVSPGDFGKYRIFVQSSSVNRRLIAGTQLIVLK